MKNLLLLIVVGLIGFVLFKQAGIVTPAADPVQMMERRLVTFPKTAKLGDTIRDLRSVRYNVEKTNSLSAPIIGTVYFTVFSFDEFRYQIVFHWKGDAWEFSDLDCLNAIPARESFALEALDSPQISEWIARGETLSAPPAPATPVITQSPPPPTPKAVPKPTPDPLAEIERKYGTK